MTKNIIDKLDFRFTGGGEKIYIECCVCHKYRGKDGDWYEKPEEVGEIVSHSYCTDCYAKAMEEIKSCKK